MGVDGSITWLLTGVLRMPPHGRFMAKSDVPSMSVLPPPPAGGGGGRGGIKRGMGAAGGITLRAAGYAGVLVDSGGVGGE